MGTILPGPVPEETIATCDRCVMCGTEPSRERSPFFFNPATKCCTYQPRLPNFLVGRILADASPEAAAGRQTVLDRMRAGVGATPLGLQSTATFDVLYRHSRRASFGRSRSLRCPHYLDEGGRCGIWRHRNSVCATWFCKHQRGSSGQEFWQALHQLLSGVEKSLATWCVLQLDVGVEVLRALFPAYRSAADEEPIPPSDLDGIPAPEDHAAAWGPWAGREAAFYVECARRVDPLTWPDVAQICGPDVRAFSEICRTLQARLGSHEIPERLEVGDFHVAAMAGDECRLTSYSEYDPLDVPRILLEVLPQFDGRPVPEVLQAISREQGIDLDEELVLKLVDFKILVPASPLPSPISRLPSPSRQG